MSEELIKKNALISTLKNWLSEDMTAHSTMYGDGYDDAVQDIIKLIETEMPVNAVELPCKIEDKVFEPIPKGGTIYSRTVKGFTVSDRIELINCETKNFYWCEIGDNVFLTREEAEKALEDLENG